MRYSDRRSPTTKHQQQQVVKQQPQQEQQGQTGEHERAEIDTCTSLAGYSSTIAGNNQLDKGELFVGQPERVCGGGGGGGGGGRETCYEASIDSQSILTNKLKLKKFWEEKMELDLKSAGGGGQQAHEVQLQNGNAPPATLKRHPKKQARQIKQHNVPANSIHDENNNHENNCQPGKARYWPTDGQSAAERSCQNDSQTDEAPAPPQQRLADKKLASAQLGLVQANHGQPLNEGVIKGDSNQGQTLEEQQPPQQLMSIDPSLCHLNLHNSNSTDTLPSEQPLADSSGSLNNNNNDDKSSNSVHEEHLDLREEQSAQEEFSSSNSSFGPMSISISVARSNVDKCGQVPCLAGQLDDKAKIVSDQEDEELNSTQSGSVLTVITNPVEHKPTDPRESNERAKLDFRAESESEDDRISCDADADNQPINSEKVNEDDASNIGVAFESLHFDTEVKSSRHEQVDGELLLAAVGDQPRPTRPRSLVGAREVKSVCNFIAAAISDATRQVDNLVNGAKPAAQLSDGAALTIVTQPDEVGSIERATFVQEPSGSSLLDELNPPTSLESPRADLSSMFEANVRREIERFESNSAVRKAFGNGSKTLNNNGITERRIAEEIRLFNEREMELKQRYQDNQQQAPTPTLTSTTSNTSASTATGTHSKATHETIVRFGKSFQIPKATACSQESKMTMQAGKAIKLSSSGGPKGSQATISMHKFIASGGRRFVLTEKLQQQSAATATGPHLAGSQLTKSMLNLASEAEPDQPTPRATRADYKAVDSLNCKETPNVKPGLTRMVIETFSRMSDEARSCSTAAAAPPSSASPGSAQADGRPPGRTKQAAKSWAAGGWARMREAQSPIS